MRIINQIATIYRLLVFKITKNEILGFEKSTFIVGLIGTWIVGMGRYWDDPEAKLMQHLGLGSVIYIFVLALLIWLILMPYRIREWSYFRVLTFISLTSFPAIFYAIPVEKFVSMQLANSINVWFLLIVAIWRLALLFYFLHVFTRLNYFNIFVLALMPMCLIISILTALNLHRVVFNVMSGIRIENPHSSAYTVLIILTGVSVILIGPLIIAYMTNVYKYRKQNDQSEN